MTLMVAMMDTTDMMLADKSDSDKWINSDSDAVVLFFVNFTAQ